jgi:glycosyltransferase involved in cell wall biosynthesis
MKIGVMLRDIFNQTDAPGIIILNLLDHMLRMDQKNEYILFYMSNAFIDRYKHYPNVKTVLVRAPGKLLWDQVAIPAAARREGIDLLFHPKHTVPLLVNCKTLMHLRGSEYWTHPEHFERFELLYQHLMLPLYCKKASHVIVESDYVKKDFQQFLHIPEEKMTMIYIAQSDRFQLISDPARLAAIRKKYNLPSDFVLTVTRIVQGAKYYPGKNLVNAIRGFQLSKASKTLKFVIVGKHTKKFVEQLDGIPADLREQVIGLDFVPQEDLPEIYNMAKFFLFPSNYESFGVPIAEAMACGCPVITSNIWACPETVGKAGLLVDPKNISEIANAIDQMNFDDHMRECLRRKGFDEVERFKWSMAAKQTLEIINTL